MSRVDITRYSYSGIDLLAVQVTCFYFLEYLPVQSAVLCFGLVLD